jgi:hypothetical protein
MKLGDFLTAINKSKQPLMDEDEFAEKEYPAFPINRTLSYFADTVLYANEMNRRHWIDPKLQFDYLRTAVRQKSRFSRWHKPTIDEDVKVIQQVYGYSSQRAMEVLDMLTPDQMEALRQKLNTGGRGKKR